MTIIDILESILGSMPEDNVLIQNMYYVFGFVITMFLLKVLLCLFSSLFGFRKERRF